MLEGFLNMMRSLDQPANRNAFVNATGQAGAAFSQPGSWQSNLGTMMSNYSQMQQYNNALNKQMGTQTSAPTPASITVKYPQAVGTPGGQGDVGASPAPAPVAASSTGQTGAVSPFVPQGTGLPTNNPTAPSLGSMNPGQMMGNYSNLPFLLALRR